MHETLRRAVRHWLSRICVLCVLAGSQSSRLAAQAPLEVKPADEKAVREVWQRLMAVLDVEPPEEYDVWPPVLDPIDATTEVNAFATYRTTEDGKVEPYISLKNGWVQLIGQGDLDRLAFVLGHELGHHVFAHPIKQSEPVQGRLTQLAFTRSAEEEADTFGIQIALKAGFSMRGAIASWRRFLDLGLDYSSFEGKGVTHPSWTERIQRLDEADHAPLWKSMLAFRNGVFLLHTEHYALAERCFHQVTQEFPDCHEAWANMGFAQLMLYCDGFEIDDLRKYNVGHLALGAFYERPKSLERLRGIDEELWFKAVGSLCQALVLKRELVIPKVNLGLAYMLSPTGPQVGRAERFFEAALRDADQVDAVDPTARLAVLINAAVVDLAGGKFERSSERLRDATRPASVPPEPAPTLPHFLSMALAYNEAMLLAATKGQQGRKDAVDRLRRNYLMQADPTSAWWTLAYEQYQKLCRELDIEPQAKEDLQRKRSAKWRPVTTVTLRSGKKIDLVQTVEEVVAQLGTGTRIPVLTGIRLDRLHHPDLGIDLLATGKDLLAIRIVDEDAGTIELRGTGLATERQELKVGMDKAELETLIEREFPSQGLATKNTLRLDGIDALYRWYPVLGLAVLVEGEKVTELVVVPLTRI